MKLLKKITGSLLALGMLLLIFAPTTYAQSVLDDIKGKLEGEGIAVIDYSTPEGAWGSLSSEWARYLSGEGYTSIANLAEDYVGEFEDIAEIKMELAAAEAEKTILTISTEIDDKEGEIRLHRLAIKAEQDGIKGDIGEIIDEATLPFPDGFGYDKEEGINMIFHEVDFYYNYNKWGRLPQRIITEIETTDEKYISLIDFVKEVALDNGIDPDQHADFNRLLAKVGLKSIELALDDIENLSNDDVDIVLDSLQILGASGERQITEVARSVVNALKNLIAGLAVIWIVYAGARMMFAQGDENIITEQKRAIIYGVIGLVTILLVDRGIDYLYGPAGVVRTELIKDQGFSNEIYGLVTFLKAVIGTIAMLFIIVSGGRMLFAAGEEQQITKQKHALLWVGVGLILIAIDRIIVEQIFIIPTQEQSDQIRTSNITSLINTMGSVFQFILGFVGLIAFGTLVYGAATMIMNYGNDEMVQKSRKIIKNAIIGILVILSAYTIVATLVVFK